MKGNRREIDEGLAEFGRALKAKNAERAFLCLKLVKGDIWPEVDFSETGTGALFQYGWTDRMDQALCEHELLTFILGCSGLGKSRNWMANALVLRWTFPRTARVIYQTTSVDDSMKRGWKEVIDLGEYAQATHGMPFQHKKAPQHVIVDPAHPSESYCIKLEAADRSTSHATGGGVGGHFPIELRIYDEVNEFPYDVTGSLENLVAAHKILWCAYLMNPKGWEDHVSKHMIPSEEWCRATYGEKGPRGIKAIMDETTEWRSTVRDQYSGLCIRMPGWQSPAYEDESLSARFPWMPSRKTWDLKWSKKDAKDRDKLRFWDAMPVESLGDPGILNEALAQQFGLRRRRVIWDRILGQFAGFDAAYTAGGDRACVSIAKVGMGWDEGQSITLAYREANPPRFLILFEHGYVIPIIEGDDLDILYKLVADVRVILARHKVPSAHLTIDTTFAPTSSYLYRTQIGDDVMLVDSRRKASERTISPVDLELSSERFANRGSEMLWAARIWTEAGCLRGLGGDGDFFDDALSQLKARHYDDSGSKARVETKGQYRDRMKAAGQPSKSPDESDSAVLCLDGIRERHSPPAPKTPEAVKAARRGYSRDEERLRKEFNASYEEAPTWRGFDGAGT